LLPKTPKPLPLINHKFLSLLIILKKMMKGMKYMKATVNQYGPIIIRPKRIIESSLFTIALVKKF